MPSLPPSSGSRLGRSLFEEPQLRRLTAAAALGIRQVAADWRLTTKQASALLATSPTTWQRIRLGCWAGVFNQDQMMRVSALVGTYRSLHLLFADDMADRWPRLPNSAPLFTGKSPIDAMIDGGIPMMIEVRCYIDAMRGAPS